MEDDRDYFFFFFRTEFKFLIDQYGFKPLEKRIEYVNIVRYESTKYFVHLQYGSPDYEVKMVFGRIGKEDIPGDKYGCDIGEILDIGFIDDWEWGEINLKRPLSQKDRIFLYVEGFARFMREYYNKIFLKDKSLFDRLKAKYELELIQEEKQENIKRIKEKAQSAWKQKDYKNVKYYYSMILKHVSKSELKKYEYSIKKMKN